MFGHGQFARYDPLPRGALHNRGVEVAGAGGAVHAGGRASGR